MAVSVSVLGSSCVVAFLIGIDCLDLDVHCCGAPTLALAIAEERNGGAIGLQSKLRVC